MLRVGIVGGGFGRLVHLPAWRAQPGVAVVAVADGGSGNMAAAAPSATYVPGWQALLDLPGLDALSIAAPPALHVPIAAAAVQRGLHMLCEKPFGHHADPAADLAALWPPGRIGAVSYQFRYEPGLLALRDAVRDGAIGTLRRIAVTWVTAGRADPRRVWGFQHDAAQGGGVIEAFLGHCIDYATWLAGCPVRRVWARGDILVSQRPDSTGVLRAVTAEDSVDAVLEFEGGIVLTAAVSNCRPGRNIHRIALAGDAGWAELDQHVPSGPHALALDRGGGVVRREWTSLAGDADSRVRPFTALVADFVAAIRGNATPDLPRLDDAVGVRRVLRGVHRAVATGGWVAIEADC